MKKITGAITAIVTPFQKNGDIDVSALKNFVQFQIENGINGIVPCGSTGEAATMTNDEYALVVKTVAQEVAGEVPVIAGAGSNNTQKAIEFSHLAKKAGADVLLHVTPFYNKPTLNGLIAHYKAIAEAVNMPILLYNVPGRTGLNVTDEMTLTIAKKVPQVIGVKEASGDIIQMMNIIKNAPSYFSVLSGDDALTFPLLSLGGDGIISVVSNEVPEEFSKFVSTALSGDFAKARKMHYQLLDLMNINFIETNPQPVKTALAMMGKMQEVFRLPLVPMSDSNKQLLKEVLEQYGLMPNSTSQQLFQSYK
ncbi:MAG TPA: 4-hydroxy-tetrahydrodipicolinate synthase [Candidatus Acidoferrales bacterium]|nr:4-hydroxy-tetrahydrodipicolinate synthase [Candidatus Acidoferrales bacterium]